MPLSVLLEQRLTGQLSAARPAVSIRRRGGKTAFRTDPDVLHDARAEAVTLHVYQTDVSFLVILYSSAVILYLPVL